MGRNATKADTTLEHTQASWQTCLEINVGRKGRDPSPEAEPYTLGLKLEKPTAGPRSFLQSRATVLVESHRCLLRKGACANAADADLPLPLNIVESLFEQYHTGCCR